MPNKLTFEYVKNYINKDNELISKKYINNKEFLDIKCHKCLSVYKQNFARYHRGHRCKNCALTELNEKRNSILQSMGKLLKTQIRICIKCNKTYNPKRTAQKLCSLECAQFFQKTDLKTKKNAKEHGKKGGIASAAKQVRRSKAEIMFADLCIEHFGKDNILCNVPFFKDKNGNLWDADIIITNIKMSVLYNGIWHYQQVRKNHNLNQVQTRDTIKKSIILENGYNYHIVKDMGKFNPKFVQDQFNFFIHTLNFRKSLDLIVVT